MPEKSLAQYAGKFSETPYTGRSRPTGYPHDYAKQATPRAATAAIISHMDRSVGKIFTLLKELGIDSKTVVFFTRDNGATPGPSDPDFFGACGPLRGYKGDLYEGGIRVPMIVRWPGKIRDGDNHHPWYFADVLPTLAELAGVRPPRTIDGISVAPTLLGEDAVGREQPSHEFLYWELRGRVAVRMGSWKAVRPGHGKPLELYDLSADISETTDVGASHPVVMTKIASYLRTARTEPRPQKEPKGLPGRGFR